MSKAFAVLVRKTGCWERWSGHDTLDEAKTAAERVQGKGITAWTWWGPEAAAVKLLEGENPDG